MTDFFTWIIGTLREFSFFVTILPWEKAVRVRMGNRTEVLTPGWYFRIPFADSFHIVNTRIRTAHTSIQTITSLDRVIITVAFSIGFSIFEPLVALAAFREPELSCIALVQSETAFWASQRNSKDMSVPELEAYAKSALQKEIGHFAHVEFVKVVDFAMTRTYRIMSDAWRTDPEHKERTI